MLISKGNDDQNRESGPDWGGSGSAVEAWGGISPSDTLKIPEKQSITPPSQRREWVIDIYDQGFTVQSVAGRPLRKCCSLSWRSKNDGTN